MIKYIKYKADVQTSDNLSQNLSIDQDSHVFVVQTTYHKIKIETKQEIICQARFFYKLSTDFFGKEKISNV